MAQQVLPIVGDWYQTVDGNTFEVVAYDPEDESIDIQYFDGALEELDLDTWLEMDIEAAEPPEDWSGSLDMMTEDYGVDLDRPASHDHNNPLDELDGL
ncbi:hypothetical protein CAI21_07385 [Alkalilimnicola ehrlichii]|uniref:Uncharacterized protein n=1 Tax=Alkalilimnicola ehrlichii TaxID=351052 RepID=A0A3E0WZQ2_9GAMM|nr:DUF6763 family protein [Alkalilimnicola ehrlichii]RFA30032.1 hypothetical protein CAI21_07385 [Alkalilimnicola ehrlichii]RFA37377.1 hypothetical protein CAL65_08720 [Alkalilimnicola ehrlichii]